MSLAASRPPPSVATSKENVGAATSEYRRNDKANQVWWRAKRNARGRKCSPWMLRGAVHGVQQQEVRCGALVCSVVFA